MTVRIPRAGVVIIMVALLAVSGAGLICAGTTAAQAASRLNAVYAFIDTNYSVPVDNVKWVSPTGSDTGDGSQASPYQTLKTAYANVSAGGTIVVQSGIYRQPELSVTKANITIQAAPHAEVWIKGSRMVSNWTASGPTWVASGWAPQFCDSCTVNPDSTVEGLAAYPEQLFINDQPVTQVATQAEVTPGTFYVDQAEQAIYLGSDPTGQTVEVSEYQRALTVTGAGFRLLGINIAQYAPQQDFARSGQSGSVGPAMIYTSETAVGVVIENCLIVQSAADGLLTSGSTGAVIQSTEFLDNGANGLAGNKTNNFTIQNNTFIHNNAAGFVTDTCGSYCTVSDVKITHSQTILFSQNFIANTPATGFWCDEGCIDTTIVNNFISGSGARTAGSGSHGIFYEVSSQAIIAGNIVEGATNGGISVGGSDHLQIYNNTLSRNKRDLRIYEDPRINGCNSYDAATSTCLVDQPWSESQGLSWDTTNIDVYNNIMSKPVQFDDTIGQSVPFFTQAAVQQDNSVVISPDMFTGVDNNAYWRTSTTDWLWVWDANRDSPTTHTIYTSLAKVTAGTGFEAHGIDQAGAVNTNFVHEGTSIADLQVSDYHLTADSPLKNAGTALPQDIAQALGVTPGVPVDMGALNNPWMTMPLTQGPQVPSEQTTEPSPTPTPATTTIPDATPTPDLTSAPTQYATPTPNLTSAPTQDSTPTSNLTSAPTQYATPTPNLTSAPTQDATPTSNLTSAPTQYATPTPVVTSTPTRSVTPTPIVTSTSDDPPTTDSPSTANPTSTPHHTAPPTQSAAPSQAVTNVVTPTGGPTVAPVPTVSASQPFTTTVTPTSTGLSSQTPSSSPTAPVSPSTVSPSAPNTAVPPSGQSTAVPTSPPTPHVSTHHYIPVVSWLIFVLHRLWNGLF